IEIRNEDFMETDLHDATIVYCGLGEVDEDVALFGRKLKTGCKIVSLFLPFVAILPVAADYPFYLMKVPFRKTKDVSLWTSKVLFTDASVEELYQELDTDREYRYDKRTFKRMMKKGPLACKNVLSAGPNLNLVQIQSPVRDDSRPTAAPAGSTHTYGRLHRLTRPGQGRLVFNSNNKATPQ